jgi:hypothetical protein
VYVAVGKLWHGVVAKGWIHGSFLMRQSTVLISI